MSATVTQLDPIRQVAREADNLCGLYGYGRHAAETFRRKAIRSALTSGQPTQVIARQCVPPKWKRLGDGPTGPEAA